MVGTRSETNSSVNLVDVLAATVSFHLPLHPERLVTKSSAISSAIASVVNALLKYWKGARRGMPKAGNPLPSIGTPPNALLPASTTCANLYQRI